MYGLQEEGTLQERLILETSLLVSKMIK